MQVDWFRLLVGVFAIGFGLYSLFIRGKSSNSTKLNAIKNYWGESKGNLIHLIFYGVLPIILGALVVLKAIGFKG